MQENQKNTPLIAHQDLELEAMVIGIVLVENSCLYELNFLRPHHFTSDLHAKIYEAAHHLFFTNRVADPVSVRLEMESRGYNIELATLATFVMAFIDASPIGQYGKVLLSKYTKRVAIANAMELITKLQRTDSDVEDCLLYSMKQSEDLLSGMTSMSDKSTKDKICEALVTIEEAVARREQMQAEGKFADVLGVPTGLRVLDMVTGGWQPSDFIVIGGTPAMGKTAFAILNILAALFSGKTVLFFSIEMSSDKVIKRMLSVLTSVSTTLMREGQISQSQFSLLQSAAEKLTQSNLIIKDSKEMDMTIENIKSVSRRTKATTKGDMVVFVDYLQLIKSITPYKDNTSLFTYVSKELKAIANIIDSPVIVITSLTKDVEKRVDKRPTMGDVRESGQIVFDADLLIFLYRDEYYKILHDENGESTKGKAEIIISKNRNGAVDTVKAAFNSEYTRYGNLEDGEDKYYLPNRKSSNLELEITNPDF